LYVDYTIRLGQFTVLFCVFPKNFSVSLKVFYHFFSRGGSIPFSFQKNFLYERIPPRCNNVNLAIFCFYGAARHGKEYTLHKIPARPAACAADAHPQTGRGHGDAGKPTVGCIFPPVWYNGSEVITLDKQLLGAFIAERRKQQGMTQAALAQALHVTDKAVSKWERGGSLR